MVQISNTDVTHKRSILEGDSRNHEHETNYISSKRQREARDANGSQHDSIDFQNGPLEHRNHDHDHNCSTPDTGDNVESSGVVEKNEIQKFHQYQSSKVSTPEGSYVHNVEPSQHSHTTDDLNSEDDPEPEPDWETIAKNEPAKNDVPRFLAARDKRNSADERFAAALDDAHDNLKQCCDDLLNIAAVIINAKQEKMNAMETQIKHDFIENEVARSNMSKKLQEFAAQAQAQFQELMMRLANGGNA